MENLWKNLQVLDSSDLSYEYLVVSPYDIAIGVKQKINPALIVEKETYENLLKKLPNRRVNTILDTDKLKKTGYVPRNGKDALNWCLENYGK